jgi:hypothetical protein
MRWPIFAALTVVLSFGVADGSEQNRAPEGFLSLFNGKDLSGWKILDGNLAVWGVDHGLLYVKGEGGGWLMTEKEYGDFDLRLEYRMSKLGNSGVALRAPMHGNPSYQGMEIQLIDDANWPNLRPSQFTGSIYDVVAPSVHVSRQIGHWNEMHITAQGRHVRVVLNGTMLVDANLDDHKDRADKHPGLMRTKGHLGLQSHSSRVEFRNLYVKDLSEGR